MMNYHSGVLPPTSSSFFLDLSLYVTAHWCAVHIPQYATIKSGPDIATVRINS